MAAFPVTLHLRPAKARISLRIRAVWPVFPCSPKTLKIFGCPQSALWRQRSDCTDAKADLSLRWAHTQSCRKCYAWHIQKYVLAFSKPSCCRFWPHTVVWTFSCTSVSTPDLRTSRNLVSHHTRACAEPRIVISTVPNRSIASNWHCS